MSDPQEEATKRLGDRLRIARQHAGLTYQEAAEQAGLGEEALLAFEAGTREPSIEDVVPLARLYGVTLDHLAGREFDPVTQTWVGETVDDGPRQGVATKVAAILIVALLLTGATVAWKVLWPDRSKPVSQTLDYRSGLIVLLDVREDADSRRRALLDVSGSLRRAVQALRERSKSPGADGARAREYLKTFNDVLQTPPPPMDLHKTIQGLEKDLDELTRQVATTGHPSAQHAAQVAAGLAGIQMVAGGSDKLAVAARASVRKLRREIGT